jgi:hypothetical protein
MILINIYLITSQLIVEPQKINQSKWGKLN